MFNIVMAYYENPGMLEHHINNWNTFKTKPNVFIADDGSPRNPAIEVVKAKKINFPLRLFRVVPNIPWNQNGARNLAMRPVNGWCLLTDIDHELPERCYVELLRRLKKKKLNVNHYYIPERYNVEFNDWYKRHPNSYIIHSSLYWTAGGMNEAFAGYYGSDKTFRRQLESLPNTKGIETSKDIFLNLYGRNIIPDASTVDFGRKDSKYYIGKHPHMSNKKKLAGKPTSVCNFEWYEEAF